MAVVEKREVDNTSMAGVPVVARCNQVLAQVHGQWRVVGEFGNLGQAKVKGEYALVQEALRARCDAGRVGWVNDGSGMAQEVVRGYVQERELRVRNGALEASNAALKAQLRLAQELIRRSGVAGGLEGGYVQAVLGQMDRVLGS